jgi:hypothetical protein
MEKSKLTETEKGERGKSKVKSMLIIFFDTKGIVHKEFVVLNTLTEHDLKDAMTNG